MVEALKLLNRVFLQYFKYIANYSYIARLHGERIYNYIHCKNKVCIPYQMM